MRSCPGRPQDSCPPIGPGFDPLYSLEALDYFVEYFKSYSADRSIGAGLSAGLARLRDALNAAGHVA